MNEPRHPEDSALIRHLDGELAEGEWRRVEAHLAKCGECRDRQEMFRALSDGIEAGMRGVLVAAGSEERVRLTELLAQQASAVKDPGRVLRRFGWGMALAAGLALAVLVAPVRRMERHEAAKTPERAALLAASDINVNGENFIALPYSNPDLPLNASRIVEMQVPVAALADAGIALQPGWSEAGDGMVAANVLLGIDGQPLGIDVLGGQ